MLPFIEQWLLEAAGILILKCPCINLHTARVKLLCFKSACFALVVVKQSAGWGKNLIKQHCYVIFHDETLDVGSGEEALGDHVLELLQKRIKKTTCVEQRDGLMMKSELPLAQKLRELFKGT